MTCVVNKGASLAVVAVMLGAVKLLTKFGFVVLGNGLSFGELLLSMGKSALKKVEFHFYEHLSSTYLVTPFAKTSFPLCANFGLAHCFKLLLGLSFA